MLETTYVIHTDGTTLLTTDAAEAETYARGGHRVTAVTKKHA